MPSHGRIAQPTDAEGRLGLLSLPAKSVLQIARNPQANSGLLWVPLHRQFQLELLKYSQRINEETQARSLPATLAQKHRAAQHQRASERSRA